MIAILIGVKCNFSGVLICISFVARDDKNFVMCIWPPVLYVGGEGGSMSSTAVLEYVVPPKQILCHAHLAGLQNHWVENWSATGQCRQKLCHVCLVVGSSQMLAAHFLRFCALRYYWPVRFQAH
jgi:hypothetical protein